VSCRGTYSDRPSFCGVSDGSAASSAHSTMPEAEAEKPKQKKICCACPDTKVRSPHPPPRPLRCSPPPTASLRRGIVPRGPGGAEAPRDRCCQTLAEPHPCDACGRRAWYRRDGSRRGVRVWALAGCADKRWASACLCDRTVVFGMMRPAETTRRVHRTERRGGMRPPHRGTQSLPARGGLQGAL
jgi:hypothetical protein